MISEEKFNALLPAQKELIQAKKLLDIGFEPGHWLMMIITELSEAINAHRSGNSIPVNKEPGTYSEAATKLTVDNPEFYRRYTAFVKGTFQDEIADVYIRLMSYCAIRNITIETNGLTIPERLQKADSLPGKCMVLTGMLWKAYYHYNNDTEETYISQFFHCMNYVVLGLEFKAETFIDFKMEYNKSMKPLNNKLY